MQINTTVNALKTFASWPTSPNCLHDLKVNVVGGVFSYHDRAGL